MVKTESPKRAKDNLDLLPDSKGSDGGDGMLGLNSEILKVLDKPESKVVLTWGGIDPTLYKDE